MMKKAFVTLLAVAGLALSACGSSGGKGPYVYAADGSRNNPGYLYKIYVETAEAEVIGPVQTADGDYRFNVNTMALGPDGLLYAYVASNWGNLEYEGDSYSGALITIDPETGTAEMIGTNDNFDNAKGMVFIDGDLYAARANSESGHLMIFDLDDGTFDTIGSAEGGYPGGAQYYDGESLYRFIGFEVSEVNLDDGTLSNTAELDFDDESAAIASVAELDGVLYGVFTWGYNADVELPRQKTLIRIDLDSGAITEVGGIPGGVHAIVAPAAQ